jgi:transcriptional regulator with XRE-family HTH domain
MTDMRASDLVARRIQETRRKRGWKAKDLAAECSRIGAPQITTAVIANIETGRRDAKGNRRRDLTIDELLVFAYALGVRPADLLDTDSYEHISFMQYEVPARDVADWVRGKAWAPIQTVIADGFARCGSCGVAVRVGYDDDSAIYRYYCTNEDCARPVACPVKDIDEYVRQRVFSVMEGAATETAHPPISEGWLAFPLKDKREIIHALIRSITIFPEETRIRWAWEAGE